MANTRVALNILIVEDDPSLRETLEMLLNTRGFTVRSVSNGESAIEECKHSLPDIVLLDVMLPRMTGLEVCDIIRSQYDPPPGVIMVTAKGTEVDVVLGLEVGADDYVMKPFRTQEIVARIRALARRMGRESRTTESTTNAFEVGRLVIDGNARRATVSGNSLSLTPTEFDLLLLLVRTPDRVWARTDLLRHIWESQHEGYARNVDCHVVRLRKKLEQVGIDGSVIRTSRGTGYAFDPAALQ
jgi:two-component system, OmpR family, response regulator VicR